ncbi:adenylate cyclase type 10-like isoform X2 [Coccinella septempunctata]|uniref:adenylate cyclase type 10-like isoform X2 n=1 Tax=Coccinella septempunctata TaxID=41139 RepID=UPI001D08D981|nr:adenylate cyclase type 10-like isoform X2 [Coccinella septempunctata]
MVKMSRKKHVGDFFSIMDQEEYVWAMRTSAYDEQTQENANEYKDEADEFSIFQSKNVKDILLVYKTTILSSFVPDEIILNVNDYTTKTSDACILCGDVSGFTELCETYNQIGSGGPSRLTDMLNNFIGAMVQEIMSHGGDVIKFSGDAFLALWKSEGYSMRDYIQEAINCALIIQKSHNNYITDVGVTLRVKLAISSGTVLFSLIGDSLLSHYIEVGQPILDTKDILDICHAGDIIVSEKTYAFVDASSYLAEEIFNGKYFRIFGVGESWRQVQKYMTNRGPPIHPKLPEEGDSISSSSSMDSILKRKRSSDEFALRPIVNEAANNAERLYEDLKKFIIPPVMQRIELNEPLEYLTELRQVTVIMINIVPHSITFDSLISLVKRIYRIITIHIQKFSGCINKVTCFDKDLMCVIIFGLRGLKQDLECRNALRCAGLIYEDIYVLSKVKSVSIGVSTGKTYCGVFGHTLRREYTVIGLTVNKAARLMVAYPDKVTCCNETFINCKMRESYFAQQKYIHLKGIKNPGPVYEFKYSIFDASKILAVPIYPILGRDEELLLYKELLAEFLESCLFVKKDKIDPMIKMIMIEGEAKSGKTRLVEEFMYITPPDISFQVILAENAAHNPYNVLKQMFFNAMGIAFKAPRYVKMETFKSYLIDFEKTHILCALNEIFEINYPMSEEFLNSSEEEKIIYIGVVLQYLSYMVFKAPKIFVIERMMIMDEITWQVLPLILRVRNIFLICSMRPHKKSRCETRRWVFNSKRVCYLRLRQIDKMYHAALACQMIDVEAIPPDLENAIQSKSNGNAGWIKNFLICLNQAEAIIIKPMTYKEIYENGLVVPPLYMMMRLTKNQLSIWKRIMEEQSGENSFGDTWFKYVDSCRDKFTDIRIREEIKNLFECHQEVKACITAPGFENFDKHNEQSEDVYVIKTFDSLLYCEQLVAKCGSVLGWQFPRTMLEYVVGPSFSKREKAEAVQRLFENRIFGCSRGDFTEAGDYVLLRTRNQSDFENQSIECQCQGLNIPECCSDLPKYASCGYLHFISSNFLEATYNLLPEVQKIEFHLKAARYLEKNTKKCRACGNGFFEEFTGCMEKSLKVKRPRKSIFSRLSADEDLLSHSVHSENEESFIGSHAQSSEIISSDYNPDNAYFEELGLINPKRLYKMMDRASLTRTFSMYDFSSCQCKLILNYMYGEVSKHYRFGGQYDQMLKALFAYSKSCLDLENTPETFIMLDIAEEHLKNKGISDEEPYWKLRLLEGKVYSLRGRGLLQTNQVELAEQYLLKALDKYGAPFPKSNFARYIKSYVMKIKQKFGLYIYPDTLSKQLKRYEAEYFSDVAECLHWLTQLFVEKNEFKQVELSAIWGLHCALKANYEFPIICQSFTNMVLVAQRNGNNFHCLALEIHSLRYCHKKISNIESDDLKYVAELYHAIRGLRCSRSEVDKSIYMGYIALRLAISVNHLKLVLRVIPRLVLSLMFKSYLPEACSLLNELDYYSSESDCNSIQSGRLAFHVACLRFQIETGYSFIPYSDSEKFYYEVNLQLAALKDPVARIEFVSLMWLWNCRNRHWEYTSKWRDYIEGYVDVLFKAHIGAPYSIMYVLEGYLLSLVHSKNSQNIRSYNSLNRIIRKLFKCIERLSKFAKVILPRLKHFQAYYEYIKGHEEKALKMLENALIYAAKCENALELVHINHSKLAWSNQLSRSLRDKWVNHCNGDNILDYRILEGYEDKIISFTLPKPIYV